MTVSLSKNLASKNLPEEILQELVGLMFTPLPSAFVTVAIYIVAVAVAFFRTGDAFLITLAIAGAGVGFAQIALGQAYRRVASHPSAAPGNAQSWQFRYASGACLFSACIGGFAARALMTEDVVVHLLATVLTLAYGTRVIVHMAVRPAVANLQVMLLWIGPAVVSAVRLVDSYYAVFLALQILLLIGALQLIAYLNHMIVERLLARGELRLAVESAEEARQRAEQTNQAKTEFLATMSHEIRTPLNGILGYADLLIRDQTLAVEQRRQVERIQSAGSALLTVVDDILDFSKIEAGEIKLEPLPFSPLALVQDAMAIVKGVAQRKGLPIEIAIDPTLPDALIGDEARLRQILLNLLNNAIKFTREGFVRVSVHHLGEAGAGQTISFSVEDSGIGIPPDKRERLFKRFSQIDGSISREYGGTGLGLAISKQLVDMMGGHIDVKSEPNIGSTFSFTVTLPLATSQVAAQLPVHVPEQPVNPARILVVEDVEINQELARAVLEASGHHVDIAANGIEAIAAVKAAPYDLVLMDIQMPGMDGLTATRIIRQQDIPARNVPIIAMTANVLPQQVSTFKQAGMDDHIGKPFRRDELFGVIARWTNKASFGTIQGGKSEAANTVVDYDVFEGLKEVLGADMLNRLVDQLVVMLDERLVGDCATPEDSKRLAQDAHSIVSAAGTLGFIRLAKACQELEAAILSGELVEPILEKVRAARLQVLSEVPRLRHAA